MLLFKLLGLLSSIFLVFDVPLLTVFLLLVAEVLDALDLLFCVLLLLSYFLFDGDELGKFCLLEFLSLVGFVRDYLLLLLDECPDLFTHHLFHLELLFKLLDLIPDLILFPGVESPHALELALDLPLLVTALQLTLSLCLIDSLLEPSCLIGGLLSILGELVLFLLQIVVDLLDLLVQVTVKHLQLVELSLLLKALIDLGLEVVEGLLFLHLHHQLLDLD